STSSAVDEPFCNKSSAMAMGMKGFEMKTLHKEGGCQIFLFADLVLDSPWKFALGCLMAFMLAMVVSLTSGRVMQVQQRLQRLGCVGRLVEVGFVGGVTVLGWFVMVIVMSFCTELFISALAGAMVGQWLLGLLVHKEKPEADEYDLESDDSSAAE
ncbi:unnamed protein product, partial [Polarella glacialis]